MTRDHAATSLLPLKPDVLMILLATAATPRHGYGIMQEVERHSEGAVVLQTGALYRTLKRMLADELIEECRAPAHADRNDERRRYYRVSRLGAAVLAAETDRMARIVRAARQARTIKRPRLA